MRLILFILLSSLPCLTFSQTVLYSENFNSGFGSFFVNTPDVNSAMGGYNQWLVNSVYAGGTFVESCVGFGVSIPNTSNQPAAITGSPQSGYMHIASTDALNSGVSCTSFQASDGGLLCNGDETYFAKMSTDVSTQGQSGVTFSFYWLCSGSASNYGELYYSTNGGTTWNLQSGSYYNSATWTAASLTNPAWDNQSQLRFGFRFVNQQSFSAADPALAIDEVQITVPGNSGNVSAQITGVTGLSFCPGTSFDVNYSATGTYNTGNVFTVELSDAIGNFSDAQAIGSVSGTSSGVISCTIPTGTVAGGNYRLRIRASNPNFVSDDFGVNFTVLAVPTIDFIENPTGNNLEFAFGCTSTGFVDWQWNFGDGGTGSGVTTNYTFSNAGVYQVCLTGTAANGCSATICKPVIAVSSDISETEQITNIFPNPTVSVAIISWQSPRTFIELFDLSGRKLMRQTVLGNSIEIDLSSFENGLYLVRDNFGKTSYVVKKN
ncbi:MAG: PKD domain-containing protein [Flavobacteriales bacterium]|jgi:hypothetical protein